MLERELEAWCRKQAGVAGCLLLKWTSPGTAGVPDRILIGPGGVFLVEFTRPGGNAERCQDAAFTGQRHREFLQMVFVVAKSRYRATARSVEASIASLTW